MYRIKTEVVVPFLKEVMIDSIPTKIDFPQIENGIGQMISFYHTLNPEWEWLIREKMKTNFIYDETILKEETGIYDNGGILIHKESTIEDVFVLIHEFAHYLNQVYCFTTHELAAEYFPIYLEMMFAQLNHQNFYIQSYYRQRRIDIMHDFIHEVLSILENTKELKLEEQEVILDYMMYIWAMYDVEASKKELQKKL